MENNYAVVKYLKQSIQKLISRWRNGAFFFTIVPERTMSVHIHGWSYRYSIFSPKTVNKNYKSYLPILLQVQPGLVDKAEVWICGYGCALLHESGFMLLLWTIPFINFLSERPWYAIFYSKKVFTFVKEFNFSLQANRLLKIKTKAVIARW